MSTNVAAYVAALDLLHQSLTPNGYIASVSNVDNYGRIWARDGVICGLAGLLSGDEVLANGLKDTLITLLRHQAPLGQIPSNVSVDDGSTSLGGLSGRVDTIAWFVLGVCNYALITGDTDFAKECRPAMEKGFQLLRAWEFNDRGLIYTPQSGNWADEHLYHGYVFYDQVLRLAAMRSFVRIFPSEELTEKIATTTLLLNQNFWCAADHISSKNYHPKAFEKAVAENKPYWRTSFAPSGYRKEFDGLANGLALLLQLGSATEQNQLIYFIKNQHQIHPFGMMPGFWPPITQENKEWDELYINHKYEFRNFPGEFHNGGLWQMVNGWIVAALYQHGEIELAQSIENGVNSANQLSDTAETEWGFYENIHAFSGKPIGIEKCTWSAAATIIMAAYKEKKYLHL